MNYRPIKHKILIILLVVLFASCKQVKDKPNGSNVESELLKIAFKEEIENCTDIEEIKILPCQLWVDSISIPIDSLFVRKYLRLPEELINKVIKLNREARNIKSMFESDYKKIQFKSSGDIQMRKKDEEKYVESKIGIKEYRRFLGDTLIYRKIRLYVPAISVNQDKAVLPFEEDGIIRYMIFRKDSVWKKTEMQVTYIP